MKEQHILSSEVIFSIHRFSVLKFSDITIDHNALCPFLPTYYQTLQPLYTEWLNYVGINEVTTWHEIKSLKNNLRFMLSAFDQFKKEVKKQTIKHSYIQLEKENYFSQRQKEFIQYANDLCIEAHGLPLEEKEYSKKEIISIIKECEQSIFLSKSHRKHHKIVPLFS